MSGAPERFDFVIVGAGVSGLSLADALCRGALGDRSILLIDRSPKDQDDRTLSYWSEEPTAFDALAQRSFQRVGVVGARRRVDASLGAYRYRTIRGLDFHRRTREALSARPNVRFVRAEVDRIEDGEERATVIAGELRWEADWVFDSRFDRHALGVPPSRHLFYQRFHGWEIEAECEAFDPEVATLFDFRAGADDDLRFVYVIPFDARRALVELVHLGEANGEEALTRYVESTLEIRGYRVVRREGGASPLTDQPFRRRVGRRVMTIGIAGGRIKPSTGYAFTRVQRDSAAIVRSLEQLGHPFAVPPDRWIYRLFDAIFLEVMRVRGGRMEAIFAVLFANNPADRVLRFLDERARLVEVVALVFTLPWWPFLGAMLRWVLIRLRILRLR